MPVYKSYSVPHGYRVLIKVKAINQINFTPSCTNQKARQRNKKNGEIYKSRIDPKDFNWQSRKAISLIQLQTKEG